MPRVCGFFMMMSVSPVPPCCIPCNARISPLTSVLDGDARAAHVRANHFGIARDRANHDLSFPCRSSEREIAAKQEYEMANTAAIRLDSPRVFMCTLRGCVKTYHTFGINRGCSAWAQGFADLRHSHGRRLADTSTGVWLASGERIQMHCGKQPGAQGEKYMSEFTRRTLLSGAAVVAATTIFNEPVHAQYVWQKTRLAAGSGVRSADTFHAPHQTGDPHLCHQRWQVSEKCQKFAQWSSFRFRCPLRADSSGLRIERSGQHVELHATISGRNTESANWKKRTIP